MFPFDTPKPDTKEPVTMGQRILGFCFAVFAGVVLLYFAVELLAQFWGWLVLLLVIVAAIWIAIIIFRRWRDRW